MAVKIDSFQTKISGIFLIFARNIDCGYCVEPHNNAVLKSTHSLCFKEK